MSSSADWVFARFRRARLRTQLLLAINLSIGVVMAGFIVFDYRHAVTSHLREKQIALSEEARTIENAARALGGAGLEPVQRFIDATCEAMNARESPGHTIEVTMGDTVIIANPSLHGHYHMGAWTELVAGSSGDADVAVRVGERRAPVLSAVRRAELGRIGAIVIAAAFGAGVLNLLLIRLVTRPLEQTARVVREVGNGRLGVTVDVHANRELSELAGDVSRMSRELARRDAERRAQLDRARRLQSHLIPLASNGDASIAIEYHPADEVAGDFADVIAGPNGDILLCVADVVGHGIHAAMGSAMLKALLLATSPDRTTPAEMLASINRLYCRSSLPEDFASMVLVRICPVSGRAVYASAGHETGYVRRVGGRCDNIGSTGMVLGVDEAARCEDAELLLEPGDLLVLLSDGVSEAINHGGTLLGRQAVASMVRGSGQSDATRLARSLVSAANLHRGGAPSLDDMTVLAFSFAAAHTDATANQRPRHPTGGDGPADDATNPPPAESWDASDCRQENR